MRPPRGHVVINMKTTITTHGGHSGYIVQSGIQSGAQRNNATSWSPAAADSSGDNSFASSQLPLQIRPSTSQDQFNTSWRDLRGIGSGLANSQQNLFQPSGAEKEGRSPVPSSTAGYEQIDRGWRSPRPATPPSPVYDFNGRASPPDEFIQPSRITLNVFDPNVSSPMPYDVGLRRSEMSTADALINDTVTTTTTVEVFRTPLDASNPNQLVALPAPPAPALDDQPQLLRVHGPPYEKWNNIRSETLINDRPVHSSRGVQWKEDLVDETESSRNARLGGQSSSRSPFASAVQPPLPKPSPQQFYVPTVHNIDERLLGDGRSLVSRSTSPFVQSPSQFSPGSSTQDNYVMSSGNDKYLAEPSPLAQSSPVYLAELRENRPRPSDPRNTSHSSPVSPVYVMPDNRSRREDDIPRREPSHRHYDEYNDDYRYRRDDRYRSEKRSRTRGRTTYDARPEDAYRAVNRRSHSAHRGRRERSDRYRRRSVSPVAHQPSTSRPASTERRPSSPRAVSLERPDPNTIGGVSRASSRDIFTLYQTRDAFDNVISQFQELDYGQSPPYFLSPMAESEESIISEASVRNDRSKCDFLEFPSPRLKPQSAVGGRELSPKSNYSSTRSMDNIYAELEEKEHIYEELDSFRSRSVERPSSSSLFSPSPKPQLLPSPPTPPRRQMSTVVRTKEERFEETTTMYRPPLLLPKRKKPAPPPRTTPIRQFNSSRRERHHSITSPPMIRSPTNQVPSNDMPAPRPEPEPVPFESESEVAANKCTSAIPVLDEIQKVPEAPTETVQSEVCRAPSPIRLDETPQSTGSPAPRSPSTVRKAHPYRISFPRITSSVPILPELTEEKEISTERENETGIRLAASIPYMDDSPRVPEDGTSRPVPETAGPAEKSQPPRAGYNSAGGNVVSDHHRLIISDWERLFSSDESDTPDE